MNRTFLVASLGLVLVLALGAGAPAQDGTEGKKFPPEQIEQLVAPIALYPDDLVSQILMAATYPLEVVEAKRWADANKSLKGDGLAAALKSKPWDPSVKSLVNTPDVLDMMDKKLDWTQDLGNAFLAQQDDVMEAIQKLRKKAMDEGNLKSGDEVNVTTEGDTIVIVSTNPEVIYVPIYNPTIIYGTWPYPRYPPYWYYPPYWRPVPTPYAFGAGIAIGAAWGYAWGRCDWHSHNVHIDIDRNRNVNRNIDRNWYRNRMNMADGRGTWQHDVAHRRGVGYADRATAQKYNRGRSPNAASREAYRGRQGSTGTRPSTQPSQRPSQRPSTARPSTSQRGAFNSYERGSSVRQQSARGQASRQSYARSHSGSRGGGARGGARGGGGRR